MNYKELKDYINSRDISEFLDLANDKKTYICPICNNGTHKKKAEGLRRIKDSNRYKCFSSSCGFNGDMLAIYSAIKGYKDLNGKNYYDCLNQYAEEHKIEIEKEPNYTYNPKPKATFKAPPRKIEEDTDNQVVKDYESKLKPIDESSPKEITDYLLERGLSEKDISLFDLKYYQDYKGSYIVWSNIEGGYTERNIKAKELKDRYKNRGSSGLTVNISDKDNLAGYNTIWVSEGLFDSLSLSRFNLNTITLNSTNNYPKLVDYIIQNKKELIGKNIIINLDNDKAGAKAEEDLRNLINTKLIENRVSLAIDYINVCEGTEFKDINEFMNNDLTGYVANLQNIIDTQIINPIDTDKFPLYDNNRLEEDLEAYKNRLPVGIEVIDKLLGGGLCNGLYILGAGSSMGKTVLLTQIMENLSKDNISIYISLEQGKFEIFGNGLRRNSYIEKNGYYWSKENRESYKSKIPNYSVIEGDFNFTLYNLRDTLNYYSDLNTEGKRIILGIDYLQALRTGDKNIDYNDKARVDKVISELKILSSSYKIPIIALSSFNREAYNSAPAFSSFKETGNIEFTGDVVLALSPANLVKAQKEAKSESGGQEGAVYKSILEEKINEMLSLKVRTITLFKLKNRFGEMKGKADILFNTKFAYFYSDDTINQKEKSDNN